MLSLETRPILLHHHVDWPRERGPSSWNHRRYIFLSSDYCLLWVTCCESLPTLSIPLLHVLKTAPPSRETWKRNKPCEGWFLEIATISATNWNYMHSFHLFTISKSVKWWRQWMQFQWLSEICYFLHEHLIHEISIWKRFGVCVGSWIKTWTIIHLTKKLKRHHGITWYHKISSLQWNQTWPTKIIKFDI